MRVCHIISGDQWAGAEVMIYRLLEGFLNYKDLEISAILLNEGKVADEFRKLGIKVVVIDETSLNFYQILNRLRNSIEAMSPDIIHSHRLKENILAYLSMKSSSHAKLICTQHGMPEPLTSKIKIFKRKILAKLQKSILLVHFKYIVVVSEDIKNSFIHQYGFPASKIITIYNGTEIPDKHQKECQNKYFSIGSAGRLFPVKDYPLMISIAQEILRHAPDIRFELAGEGPEKDDILRRINDNKMENSFHLCGFIDDISKFYKKLDLYINTSIHEGMPMSILEAMAHGIPVIAPNTGGIKEIVRNGLQGYLIDSRDPKIFADKCMELYRNRELLKEMGEMSRETIRDRFSLKVMAEKYHGLYCNAG